MQGRQRSPFDNDRLGKEDSSSLAVGGGAREQVLDFVERKTAIFQLGCAALGNFVQRRADVAQGRKFLIILPDVCELRASGDNIVVPQLFPFPPTAAPCQTPPLPVPHGFW